MTGASPFIEIGRRLKQIRQVLGWSQAAIAWKLEVTRARWRNWENGVSQVPPHEALRLKRLLPGLTLDWIYDGDNHHFSYDLAHKLDAVADEPDHHRDD